MEAVRRMKGMLTAALALWKVAYGKGAPGVRDGRHESDRNRMSDRPGGRRQNKIHHPVWSEST